MIWQVGNTEACNRSKTASLTELFTLSPVRDSISTVSGKTFFGKVKKDKNMHVCRVKTKCSRHKNSYLND